ncbi:MAG: iron-sulfur cluster insertion protein ErpA [Proteobacteria bacterium]|nr:iron-sulfur cluster insertion protein ErpA [Pseudomonadota bacterium]
MNTETESIAPIIFTLAAAKKVKSLIEEEGNLLLNLRIYITGGGCSGFQYGFTFDETINEDDFIIEKNLVDEEQGEGGEDGGSEGGSVKLLIDSASYQYLQGAKIDYREDASGAQFVISNPNAKTTCGCGSSFSAG